MCSLLHARSSSARMVSGGFGCVEEISGLISQGRTRNELIAHLHEALEETIDMNREEAKSSAGTFYEEVTLYA